MSRPRLAMLLLFVVAVAGMVHPGAAVVESRVRVRGHHHPPLLDCGPAPILSKNDDAAFRANLASALAALPSAAGAKPDTFATVHAGSAFARGACFGAIVSSSSAKARACEACLSAAARDVTGVCRASGRAGVWRNECFLSYADSSASSFREDAFRGWFYDGPSTKATLADGGECLTDRAVDCDRCWLDSSRAAARIRWWDKIHGEKVITVGYNCLLRVRVSTLPEGPEYDETVRQHTCRLFLKAVYATSAIGLVVLFCRTAVLVRALPQVNNG